MCIGVSWKNLRAHVLLTQLNLGWQNCQGQIMGGARKYQRIGGARIAVKPKRCISNTMCRICDPTLRCPCGYSMVWLYTTVWLYGFMAKLL